MKVIDQAQIATLASKANAIRFLGAKAIRRVIFEIVGVCDFRAAPRQECEQNDTPKIRADDLAVWDDGS